MTHCDLRGSLLLIYFTKSIFVFHLSLAFPPLTPQHSHANCSSNLLYRLDGINAGFLPCYIFQQRVQWQHWEGVRCHKVSLEIAKFVSPKVTLLCKSINYGENWILSCHQEKGGKKALKAKLGYEVRLTAS